MLFARQLKMSPAQYQRLYEIQQEFCAARGQKDIDMWPMSAERQADLPPRLRCMR